MGQPPWPLARLSGSVGPSQLVCWGLPRNHVEFVLGIQLALAEVTGQVVEALRMPWEQAQAGPDLEFLSPAFFACYSTLK